MLISRSFARILMQGTSRLLSGIGTGGFAAITTQLGCMAATVPIASFMQVWGLVSLNRMNCETLNRAQERAVGVAGHNKATLRCTARVPRGRGQR